MNDTLNPAWNQTFDFVVEDGLHDMLTLEVYDHDTFGKVCCCSSVLWFEISLAQAWSLYIVLMDQGMDTILSDWCDVPTVVNFSY